MDPNKLLRPLRKSSRGSEEGGIVVFVLFFITQNKIFLLLLKVDTKTDRLDISIY